MRARELLKRDEPSLKDKIFRAWGIAENAYKLSTGEAMELLSMIRLGAHYGYIDISDADEYQKLVTNCQPANMQLLGGKNISVDDRDILRARYVAGQLHSIAKRNR